MALSLALALASKRSGFRLDLGLNASLVTCNECALCIFVFFYNICTEALKPCLSIFIGHYGANEIELAFDAQYKTVIGLLILLTYFTCLASVFASRMLASSPSLEYGC